MLELFDCMITNSSTDGCVDFDTFQHVIQQWLQALEPQRR